MKKKGFTLAEALITLVIIGVIAALTIPAILINTEQNEYRSAFKKALAMLNQVIELNIALDGYGPLNADDWASTTGDTLFDMFRRRMNVISVSTEYTRGNDAGTANKAFFTADGMRYEFPQNPTVANGTFGSAHCAYPDIDSLKDESGNYYVEDDEGEKRDTPCLIIVDVNGEKRPNPRPGNSQDYKVPQAISRSKLLDVYPIIITDKHAAPYGVVAQRALFEHGTTNRK